MSVLDKLRTVVSQLGSERRGLESKLQRLKAERTALLTAPPSREQMIADRLDFVDECARRFRNLIQWDCEQKKTRPFYRFDTVQGFTRDKPFGPMGNYLILSTMTKPTQTAPVFVIGAMAEAIKPAIQEAIEKMAWDDAAAGPPTHERRRKIAALDKRISAVESQLSSLRDEADRAMRG